MRIRVKVFATLGRHLNSAGPGMPFEVNMPEGATLADLMNHLNLPREEVKTMFVNGRAQSADWVLKAGDEVGFFPPIAGG